MAGARARLTEGPVARHLVVMAVPMASGLLATMTFNLVDTYFVGQLGVDELAALSFTFPVVMILISLAVGLGAGTASAVSRAIGSADEETVRRLVTDALILALLVVAAVSALGVLTIAPLFRLLGAPERLLPLIADYMRIFYAGVVFLVVPMVGMSAIRATGEARLPGLIMIVTALINVALDPLLIFGLAGFPRLELEGAALATVIARGLGFAATIWLLGARLGLLTLALPSRRSLTRSWRSLLHVGLPAIGTNTIIPVATGVITAMLAGYGAATVAGFGVAARVEAFAMIVFYALSAVMNPFVGQNHGAGRTGRVDEALRVTALVCVAFGLASAAVLAAAARDIAALFTDDPRAIEVAALYLWIVPVSYGAAGMVMVGNAAFNGLGRPLPAVAISVTRMFGLYVPLAYVGGLILGAPGVFAGTAAANLAVGIGAYVWCRRACRRRPAAAGEPQLALEAGAPAAK